MIGPTGVGKTEIARRLAKLTASPFIKVEATKFTEVGYVGRDVESMIRDLAEIAFNMVRAEKIASVQEKAEAAAEDRLLDLLLPPRPAYRPAEPAPPAGPGESPGRLRRLPADGTASRDKMREWLSAGKLDDRWWRSRSREGGAVHAALHASRAWRRWASTSRTCMPGLMGGKRKTRKVKVAGGPGPADPARRRRSSSTRTRSPARRVRARRAERHHLHRRDRQDRGEGQRAATGPTSPARASSATCCPSSRAPRVNTRYGLIRTDHILFIAAGAFHMSKPSDLLPELQGRFPIRVELTSLKREDFVRILTSRRTPSSSSTPPSWPPKAWR